jgi:hypothetical protein
MPYESEDSGEDLFSNKEGALNLDISQEFDFGRPFCPAAAFSVKNFLSVFQYASGSFWPAALQRAKIARPKGTTFAGDTRPHKFRFGGQLW